MHRNSKDESSHMSMMLLGSTGAGKSASGNTILKRAGNPFEEGFSPEAVTRICQSERTEVDGQTIRVIDTVGLSDTDVKITDAQTQIEEMLQRTKVGIDVFLLVIKLGETFTKNDSKVVTWIRDNFGEKALKHTMVLFTHGDLLHGTVEDYLSKSEALQSVVDQCSGDFHAFNNKDKDPSQVTELLEKIESLRIKNAYKKYTEEDYEKTQKDLLLKKTAAAFLLIAGEAAAGGAAEEAAGGGTSERAAREAAGGTSGGTSERAAREAAGGISGGTVGGAAAVAVVGALATKVGGVAVTALTAAVGTAGIAVLGAAAVGGAGVYLWSRKKENNKND